MNGINVNFDSPSRPNSAEASFLFDRINYEKISAGRMTEPAFRFQTIQRILDRMENPHLAYPVIHVAGTKGKGSVSMLIASILEQTGFRVGVYTSPHLQDVRERFQVGGRMIGRAEFTNLIRQIRPLVEQIDQESLAEELIHEPTFFEITTCLAFAHFADHDVDIAVIEVGMGGRLDSTNICQSQLSVITSISLDHTDQLGNSLQSIATEKAGIIKPQVPLISGVQEPLAAEAIRKIADQKRSPIYELGKDFDFKVTSVNGMDSSPQFDTWGRMGGNDYHFKSLRAGPAGLYQVHNAALAIAAVEKQKSIDVSASHIRKGIAELKINGRFQTLNRSSDSSLPTIVLDIAHNTASIESLGQTLQNCAEYKAARKRILVFSTSRGKDVVSMLKSISNHFDTVILTQFQNNPRSVPVESLREAMAAETSNSAHLSCLAMPQPELVYEWIRQQGCRDDFVCVTGSSFLVGEFLDSLPCLRTSAK